MMKRLLFVGLSILFVHGCALTDASLPVVYDDTQLQKGPLSDAESTAFNVESLVDERPDQERVGYKKNGFGANTADINTEAPVTELVEEAVRDALETNGHSLAADGMRVSGSVSEFWLEQDVNFSHIEIICTIEVFLTFADASSGGVLYESPYRATFSETSTSPCSSGVTEFARFV